jgi:lipoprotein NlpI
MNLRARAKNYAGALEDSDGAIANGMGVAETHRFRAQLLMTIGEPDRALKELDETVRLDPRSEPTLRARGRFHFHAGRFEAAEKDFAAVLALRPRPDDPLLYAMARERRGLDARAALEAGLAKLPGGEWPAPVMSFLLGRIDRTALMAAAASGDEKKRSGQECEARFYLAERLIAKGEPADVRKLLEQVRDECPRNFIEYAAALQELAALK